ncbi:hypothetical protein GKB09_03910 [Campylobacter jejuni]|nr:hypothetical protein [Campylobacter jejuni]EHC1462469.1 hypothetical protein [Campylobacter jejuni]
MTINFIANEDDLKKEIAKIDLTKPIFCDTETIGLYGKVRLLQLTQDGKNVTVIDCNVVDVNNAIKALKDAWIVFYNASYDLTCLDWIPSKVDDLLWLVKLYNPFLKEYALDKVIEHYGFDTLYDGLNKKDLQKSKFDGILQHEQIRYAATDVVALFKLWQEIDYKTISSLMCYKLDICSLKYAIQYQRNGMSINTKTIAEELVKVNKSIVENETKLNGLNVNSPKQCKEALGVDATSKDVLLKLISNGNELAKLIYDQRRCLKKRTLLESYNYPKVYTKFNVAGAASGRFTATGKNIYAGINGQQIPRSLKYAFVSEDENIVTIEGDYSTLELRLAAAIFGDEFMYNQLKNNEDLHTSMAQFISNNKEVSDEERTKAKAINFGLVFGMSAPSFVEYAFTNFGVTYTLEEATKIRNKYFERYKTIAKAHKNIWNNYKNESYVYSTALGRRVKPKLGTDAINGPIQGSGAETTKLAIHYMVKENEQVLGKIVNVVHDSIKLEVPKDEVDYWMQLLERNMLKAWNRISELFIYKDIPMKVDVNVK